MAEPKAASALDFAALEALVRVPPFHRWLGLSLVGLTDAGVEIAMPWRDEFMNDAEARTTHGGILASFVDLSADYAVAAKLGRGVPTVDLRVDYHRGALPGPLTARANVIKLGRTLATAEARIFDRDGNLVASGRGVYLTQAR